MWRSLLLALALILPAHSQAQNLSNEYMMVFSTEGTFEEVREFVEMAITDRGMVINNVAHIGNMLERTGADIGAARQVYRQAEALEFCSATVSRATMEADPHNIVFCPYVIAVYVLPEEAERVYVSFRRPSPHGDRDSRKALQGVEDLLLEIVQDVVQ